MSYLNNELYLQILHIEENTTKDYRNTDTGCGEAGLPHPAKGEHTMNDKQLHDVLAGVALILTLVTTFVVCGFLEAIL